PAQGTGNVFSVFPCLIKGLLVRLLEGPWVVKYKGVDEEGILFCNTAFGDYLMRLPAGKWDP
ncbi:MAG: hypothetical protein ACLFSE_14010, partial [Spirochaetia bacterium]